MEITDIRFRKFLDEGAMKAIISITLDNSFVIHDVKVVEGPNGLFVAMPSRRTVTGEFRDIAHPINKETRGVMQSKILDAYFAELEAIKSAEADAPDDLEDIPYK